MILTIKLQNEHNRKSWIRFKTNNNDTLFIVYAWYRLLVNMIYVFYKYTGFKHVGWYNSSDTKKKTCNIYMCNARYTLVWTKYIIYMTVTILFS
jgi:hypothetical protein